MPSQTSTVHRVRFILNCQVRLDMFAAKSRAPKGVGKNWGLALRRLRRGPPKTLLSNAVQTPGLASGQRISLREVIAREVIARGRANQGF